MNATETTYAELRNMAENSRRRKLAHNTYLEVHEDGSLGVRLHSTEIVTLFEDGRVRLNSGGWRTVTTKERINRYLPDGWHLWQSDGVWYLGRWYADDTVSVAFDDLCEIHADGTVTGCGPDPREQRKLRKRARKYAREYVAAFCRGEVPAPSGGDCWICLMKTGGGAEHILSHFDESYFVPSLLVRAMERFPLSMAATSGVHETWDTGQVSTWISAFSLRANGGDGSNVIAKQIEKCIARYLYEQLGTAS